jgi:hypothetical protein
MATTFADLHAVEKEYAKRKAQLHTLELLMGKFRENEKFTAKVNTTQAATDLAVLDDVTVAYD